MKKKTYLGIIFLLFILFISSCTGGSSTEEPTSENTISVLADNNTIIVKEDYVPYLDYKDYFKIVIGGKEVEVLDEYIDSSAVQPVKGTYTVTCMYDGKVVRLNVKVDVSDYNLSLSQAEVTLKQSETFDYDFNQYFTAKQKGEVIDITSSMVESNVSSNVGTYQYTVNNGTLSLTLNVNVIDDHVMEVYETYHGLNVQIKDVSNIDYANLFSLYVDGQAVKVTNDMISNQITNPKTGITYSIKFDYQEDLTSISKTTEIKVVPNDEITVVGKNLVIGPNSEFIDLASLFTIKEGSKNIQVLDEYLTGGINYAVAGTYTITANYKGVSATSTIKIQSGVLITTSADVVNIPLGTNQSRYAFDKDFNVSINGISFTNISSFIDSSKVDFSTIGSYEAVLEIKVNGENYQHKLTYQVVKSNYSIEVINDNIEIEKSTTYNPFNNLKVIINNKNQTITDNKSYVDAISCYGEIINGIDYDKIGPQNIELAVYVNGVDDDPIIVSFTLSIISNVKVTAYSKAFFSGNTIYPKELFKITDGTKEINVTPDMITGKVDPTTPGVYNLTCNYQGIEAVATVIVFDQKIIGTYKTNFSTIPNDSDYDEEYGIGEITSSAIGDLIIKEDGTITVNGKTTQIISGIDENSMYIKIGTWEHYLYYDNGIIVLIPDDTVKLSYHDDKRPLIFFQESMWKVGKKIVINSSASHVLENNTTAYSIDIFNIESKIDQTSLWYGLKVHLYDRSSSNSYYENTWGVVEFAEGFNAVSGNKSSLTFNGKTYSFEMSDSTVGKTSTTKKEFKYANQVFTGIINGETYYLTCPSYQGFSLIKDEKVYLSLSSLEMESLQYGGCDYDNDIVLLYEVGENGDQPASYKFQLDLENHTFTYIEKDHYYGKYSNSKMYIFLDGYGNGVINFSKTSYYKTVITYTIVNNELRIVYQDTNPSFAYGEYAELYIDDLHNKLTTKYFENLDLTDKTFTNEIITSGAIINITGFQLEKNSNAVLGKKALCDSIKITTNSGVMTNAEILKCTDVSNVDFSTPGFYTFSITIDVYGESIVMQYALQIN